MIPFLKRTLQWTVINCLAMAVTADLLVLFFYGELCTGHNM